LLRARRDHDAADFRRMQFDSKSLIAAEVTPRLVAALRGSDQPTLLALAELLAGWDHTYPVDATAPAVFEMFQHHWTPAYAAAALPDDREVRANAGAAARRALVGEEQRLSAERLDGLIVASMAAAHSALVAAFGDDPAAWRWGVVHAYRWPHPLGSHGRLGELLDGPLLPCAGSGNVINNVAPSTSQPFVATSGPTYRIIADLSDPSVLYINSHCPTQANPASPHFADTIRDWATGNYQPLYRRRALIEIEAEGSTRIGPG
jgi:penicillin amidase